MDKFQVDQYLFETEEEYELAKSEKQKTQYIDQHLDYQSPEKVLAVYQKIIETNMFQTQIGLAYLERLYRFLIEKNLIDENSPAIAVKTKISSRESRMLRKENSKLKEAVEYGKRRNLITIAICIALAVLVVALFVIALTADNPNILNYENALKDKYSAWEEELTERENAVREKELALEIDE